MDGTFIDPLADNVNGNQIKQIPDVFSLKHPVSYMSYFPQILALLYPRSPDDLETGNTTNSTLIFLKHLKENNSLT